MLYLLLTNIEQNKIRTLKNPVAENQLWDYVHKDPKFSYENKGEFIKVIRELEKNKKIMTEDGKIYLM